jgi:PleD family two-component response regulator
MSGIDVLLRCADHTLYQAKGAGRNCVIKYTPPPEAR